MTCGEIMSRHIVFCLPEDTVEHAAGLMREEGVGPVPVVADRESKKIVGIVTDRDLAIKVVAEGRDSKITTVDEVMTRNPVTCRQEDDVQNAMSLMTEHKVRRIPISDENERVVGIVSQADIATRSGDTKKTGQVVEDISR